MEKISSSMEQDPSVQPHWGDRPSKVVSACRRLVARRYREVGFVTKDELVNGFVSPELDPYVERSEYFWKTDKDGNVIATFRMIHTNPASGELDLPISKEFELFAPQREKLHQAFSLNSESTVEISALAKENGVGHEVTLEMYKGVWQHAKRLGISMCAISVDANLHEALKAYFDSAIEEAGHPRKMMGSLTVPSLLHPNKCAEAVAAVYWRHSQESQEAADKHREAIRYIIHGLELEYLSDVEIEAFISMGLLLD